MSSGKAKLDMKHGFMKSIIRNQFDRDNYDKEVKAKVQNQTKGRHKSYRHKKPEIRTYVPPFSRQKNSDTLPENSSYEINDDREELFALEFEDRDGHIFRRAIYETDHPKDVAQIIGRERHLSPPYTAALAQRIAEEIDKRCKSGNNSNS